MLLSELLTEDRIRVPLAGRTKLELLSELVALATHDMPPGTASSVLDSVLEREADLTTGIGGGVAIPHGRTPVVDDMVVAAGVAPGGVEFDALDGAPVELLFLLVGPESASGAHVKALARISRLVRRDAFRAQLRDAASPAEFLRLVRESEAA